MRYRANVSEVRWRIVDGEAVLIHLETTYYFSLNRTGTRIWELLVAGEPSEAELVAALAGAYPDVPHMAVETDVRAWLTHMRVEGLLVQVGDAAIEGGGAAIEAPVEEAPMQKGSRQHAER